MKSQRCWVPAGLTSYENATEHLELHRNVPARQVRQTGLRGDIAVVVETRRAALERLSTVRLG